MNSVPFMPSTMNHNLVCQSTSFQYLAVTPLKTSDGQSEIIFTPTFWLTAVPCINTSEAARLGSGLGICRLSSESLDHSYTLGRHDANTSAASLMFHTGIGFTEQMNQGQCALMCPEKWCVCVVDCELVYRCTTHLL